MDARQGALPRRAACPAASPATPAAGVAHRRSSVELIEPAERTAPGQIACLYSGEVIVGHGTIAPASEARLKITSMMTSDEIRERYLSFFEQREHLRIPSASLVPSAHDPSALLTAAGMQPLKPYFLGREAPPAPRLTSCQKCFRTVDIDNVGNTLRHLTFFEMLGNFSFGDYFKREAIELRVGALARGVRLRPADIWVTVFAGDEAARARTRRGGDRAAGGPSASRASGSSQCPRSENFWQAGPDGPVRALLGAVHRPRPVVRRAEDLPGGENERFLEYWNLVFMQYDQRVGGDGNPHLQPLPANNIDTGLGLNRLAAILQGKDSVFETDQFQPLIELGEELSGAAHTAMAMTTPRPTARCASSPTTPAG